MNGRLSTLGDKTEKEEASIMEIADGVPANLVGLHEDIDRQLEAFEKERQERFEELRQLEQQMAKLERTKKGLEKLKTFIEDGKDSFEKDGPTITNLPKAANCTEQILNLLSSSAQSYQEICKAVKKYKQGTISTSLMALKKKGKIRSEGSRKNMIYSLK